MFLSLILIKVTSSEFVDKISCVEKYFSFVIWMY